MKVVLDTNVLLSGLMYPESVPGRAANAWLDARYDLALSMEQLREVGRALGYRKIQKILGWDASRIEKFLKQLYLRSDIVAISGIDVEVPADSDDAMILATFVAAHAEYLVTGDSDLLALRAQYSILSPSEFVEKL